MNFITFFKKVQIFSLVLVFVATMNAVEADHADIAEMQKEAQGTGEIVLEKLSQASDALQSAGVSVAGWVNEKWQKTGDLWQKIKKSDTVTNAEKTVKKSVQDVVEKANKTQKNVVKSVKSTTKESVRSFKNWWNNKSEYSSDELIVMGWAIVACVTIAGITYVLYKNGTIKKMGTTVTAYPALTTLSAVTFGLIIAALFKFYPTSTNVAEVK